MESNQKIEVSAVFEGAIHMDKKRVFEHMFCPLIMYIKSHLMSYKVGVGSYQRDAIRFVKSAEKSLISCGFHDFEVFFGSFVLVFYNSLEESVDQIMKNRLDTHIKVHHLQETFSSCALTELNSIKHRYKKMFLNLPISEIKSDLKEMCESAEYDDLNSWKSALYRALLRQVEEYRIWLNHI